MTFSLYSISVTNDQPNPRFTIFNGYFVVDDNINLVILFYETINGSTNYFKNILIPQSQSVLGNPDNIYQNGWLQFNSNGCCINSMSFYTNPGNYEYIFTSYGINQTIANNGLVLSNNPSAGGFPASFYISRISNITFDLDFDFSRVGFSIYPISDICFPAGVSITTNQGNIPIDKINPDIHTICNKKIVKITKTITQDKYLVCFEKNALGNNIPSQKTIISKNHSIFFQENMIQAKKFIGINNKVYKIKYGGEVLYNVLMNEHNKMLVNNLICETLHPENRITKLYNDMQKLNPEEQNYLIKKYNECIVKNKLENLYTSSRV